MSAANPSMCLDSSGNLQQKRKLILYSYHGGLNQKFRFVLDEQGNYTLVNVESGGSLEIPENSQGKAGTQCHISQVNGTKNEKWKIQPTPKGYAIISAATGLALDI